MTSDVGLKPPAPAAMEQPESPVACAHQFPKGFLLGAATAAHQVEGGNRYNDWWEAEQVGALPFRSGDCCRHYELYESDFDLLQAWGHNCHRFSVEWSRIEPVEDRWSEDAIEHYRRVVQALRARRIEPIVTLHHFSNPAWFARGGGWLRSDASIYFARYARRVVEAFGPEIRFWITINEPTVYVQQGYINGAWPPFIHGKPLMAFRALRSFAAAHRQAYSAIKARSPGAMVGLAHNALLVEPCDPRRLRHRLAARLRGYLVNGLFFRLFGLTPGDQKSFDRILDFIGLNYYTRCCVRSGNKGLKLLLGESCSLEHHHRQGARSATGWELYPQGLGVVLSQFARYGIPLIVTENGIATDDDRLRRAFIRGHLEQVARALAEGIEVLGYLHWTMMDNFEWDMGTKPKFGLAAVDSMTGRRIPRPSSELFAEVCRGKRIPAEISG